jgi:type II secretory pathway component PulM
LHSLSLVIRITAPGKNHFKNSGAALCSAVIYYAGVMPLDNMIKNSQATLARQRNPELDEK